MSFGNWNARDSEEVQGANARNFTFDSIREQYETTKPIRGKRECLNIRPVGERGRSHERIIKVSDYEYYLTCNSWARVNKDGTYQDSHCRAITFSKDQWGHGENMIVHVPRTSRGETAPSWLNSPSVFWFYHYKMPNNFAMHNHKGKKYVAFSNDGKTEYYPLFISDLVFYKTKATEPFMPLQVHREFKRELDKEQTKQLRKQIKPFSDYIHAMIDLVEDEKRTYRHNVLKDMPLEILFKQEPDESWFEFVEIYKWLIRQTNVVGDPITKQYRQITEYKKQYLNRYIYNHLYRKVKPFKITEVPIGELCYDKFKNWE